MKATRWLSVEMWLVYCWCQFSEDSEVRCRGGERGVLRSINSCTNCASVPWVNHFVSAEWAMLPAPTCPFPPNIRCAGWGWGRSTLGCSPPFNMLLLCVGEVPLLVKQWAGHILAYKRWLQWIFICAKVALLVMRLQGEILGSQMRFSDAYLLDLFECLWSISQCLTTRVCIPWYLSHSVTEEQLFLPMDSVMGNSIGGVEIYTSHELGNPFNSELFHFAQLLKDLNLPLYCAPIYGQITTSVSLNWASQSQSQ